MVIALRKIRESKGIDAPVLGEMLGVSKHTIWSWERGDSQPDPEALCQLADALDVSLDMLVRGKEKDRPEERSMDGLFNRLNSYNLQQLREMIAFAQYLQYRKEREQAEGQVKEGTE